MTDEEYRLKVLRSRDGVQREDWLPIPTFTWVSRRPDADLGHHLKMLMRLLMASVYATCGPDRVEFVILLSVDSQPGEMEISILCPLDAPIALMKRSIANRDLPTVEMEIELRFKVLADIQVPVVVQCDRRAGRYVFSNGNQIDAPRQFVNPLWCRTTSGFLNFIGARAIDGAGMMAISNLAALHDRGLDEWLRWLYCTTETGVIFDADKLLVRRDDSESWIYDYDGS